ncbi:hypothetical protein [Lutibacter sp. B1]|uniref:hypothetical protein n=1 Tax=Lutibacter sp. B1 TaxID=2725996 RepID=UPI001456D1A9|nr:hypothetical protein [Lutibacter sp. B1]NLP58224.1 hypothetical protein [Lutibacter sp. B1]
MPRITLTIFIFCMCYANGFADNINNIVFPKAEILNKYTARIPFKLIDHLIVVEAEVLNKKGNFIIDTGSQNLVLNKVHFPLQYTLNKKNNKTSGVIRIIDDPLEKKLSEFKLQNFSLKDQNSDIIDLSHIEKTKKMNLLGIIGYSILKEYEVFIDLHLNQITLTKTDKQGNKLDSKVYLEKIVDSIDFKLKKHTIVINGVVNNQKVKLGLDTAAEFNQINKSVNKKVLKQFFPKKRINLVGASNKKIEVMAGNLFNLKLSETIYFGPMKTVLTNLSKMYEVYGTSLDGVLGYEFFKYKRTIINYQKEKLYFIDYPRIRQ